MSPQKTGSRKAQLRNVGREMVCGSVEPFLEEGVGYALACAAHTLVAAAEIADEHRAYFPAGMYTQLEAELRRQRLAAEFATTRGIHGPQQWGSIVAFLESELVYQRTAGRARSLIEELEHRLREDAAAGRVRSLRR